MDKRNRNTKEIRFQQILLQDGSVYSIQWMDLPERHRQLVLPPLLLERYYRLIRDFTWSIIRPVTTDDGVEFRLFASPLALLRFSSPQYQSLPEGDAVHLCISGGFLVQSGECDRGRLSLMSESVAEGVRITVQLSDYCPLLLGSTNPSRLRRTLYRMTQAYLHKVVTVRYLINLYRELTGEKPKARVEKVRVREGRDI